MSYEIQQKNLAAKHSILRKSGIAMDSAVNQKTVDYFASDNGGHISRNTCMYLSMVIMYSKKVFFIEVLDTAQEVGVFIDFHGNPSHTVLSRLNALIQGCISDKFALRKRKGKVYLDYIVDDLPRPYSIELPIEGAVEIFGVMLAIESLSTAAD